MHIAISSAAKVAGAFTDTHSYASLVLMFIWDVSV
jgi:hypothetical protein